MRSFWCTSSLSITLFTLPWYNLQVVLQWYETAEVMFLGSMMRPKRETEYEARVLGVA